MSRECVFSVCRTWRYTLWREWGALSADLFPNRPPSQIAARGESYLMVIGLNPSTADETSDDPTIRRCIGFAKAWGFGALCMTNLFAFRSSNPMIMKAADNPVGDSNNRWLLGTAKDAGMILAAWGTHGNYIGRASAVRLLLSGFTLHALGTNRSGSPLHPLYMPKVAMPTVYPRE